MKKNYAFLPKDMIPGKEEFEKLGFVFEESSDENGYNTILPRGWSVIKDRNHWTYLLDSKGRKRGKIVYSDYKEQVVDENSFMCLTTRFCIAFEKVESLNNKSLIRIVIKDIDGSIFYEAGKCSVAFSSEYDELQIKAVKYMDENYPEWHNVMKYWD